jgi:hypothetical protein
VGSDLAYQIKVVVMRHKVGVVLLDWHGWLPYVALPTLGRASLIAGAVGLLAEGSFAPYTMAGAIVLPARRSLRCLGPHVDDQEPGENLTTR